MSKRVLEFFIIDILIAIDKIKRYSKDFKNADDFYYDEKSFDATMRELQIIGEATKHLINSNLLDKSFRVIVDFRNLIVHEYFGIDKDEIWQIVTSHLYNFEEEILKLLKNSNHKIVLDILNENKNDFKGKTLEYIEKLEKDIKCISQFQ